MTVETTPTGILIIIALMAVVTLATRYGGAFVMSFVRISPRIESFINTMASSVLIAIIVPMAFSGDAGALAYAGAGIVGDSDPGAEWDETELKLATFRRDLRPGAPS